MADTDIFRQYACLDCGREVLLTPGVAEPRCTECCRKFHGATVLRLPPRVCAACGGVPAVLFLDGWRCDRHRPDYRAYLAAWLGPEAAAR
jgi:hypothetical protein